MDGYSRRSRSRDATSVPDSRPKLLGGVGRLVDHLRRGHPSWAVGEHRCRLERQADGPPIGDRTGIAAVTGRAVRPPRCHRERTRSTPAVWIDRRLRRSGAPPRRRPAASLVAGCPCLRRRGDLAHPATVPLISVVRGPAGPLSTRSPRGASEPSDSANALVSVGPLQSGGVIRRATRDTAVRLVRVDDVALSCHYPLVRADRFHWRSAAVRPGAAGTRPRPARPSSRRSRRLFCRSRSTRVGR